MTAATTETVTDPFLTEEFHTDPNAVIARMREEDPVHQIAGLGAWMVTRYDDVRALFTHPDATNDRRTYAHYQLPSDPMARWIAENSLFAAPPDQHARQRNLVAAAFTRVSWRTLRLDQLYRMKPRAVLSSVSAWPRTKSKPRCLLWNVSKRTSVRKIVPPKLNVLPMKYGSLTEKK